MNFTNIKKLATALAVTAGFTQCTNIKKPQKPNVVFFLVDDMGWKDLGCYGAKLYETPNIDKLCSQGVKFTNAYAPAPICSPTRASVLSGVHSLKLGMWNCFHDIKPKDSKNLLPAMLKRNGYTTWHVGKWHMGNPEDKTMPTNVGFDINIGGWTSWGPGSYFWPYKTNEDGTPMGHKRDYVPLRKGGQKGEHLTDRLTREAESLIEKHNTNTPFYLNFWYYSVHNRKEAKSELIEKYKKKIKKMGLKPTYRHHKYNNDSVLTSETNATYAAMLETVDNSVGRIIESLKKRGMYENTLFVFYSDNGPTTDDVPCAPLMGGKNTTYEAGVREPAFFTWKNGIEGGKTSNDRIIIMDVYNTIMEATSTTMPESHKGSGVSLMSHFKGEPVKKRDFHWYFTWDRRKWAGRSSAAMLGKDGIKYIHFFNGDKPEMYNINRDQAELHDIYSENPDKAESMKQKLSQYLSECGYDKMKKQITTK